MRILLLAVLLPIHAFAGVILEGNTDALELVTTSAASTTYDVSWSNVTATALTTPGATKGTVASATTTTLIAAPSAANFRHVRSVIIFNNGTIANTVTLQRDVSATERPLVRVTLTAGEQLSMDGEGKFSVLDAAGRLKTTAPATTIYSGNTYSISKGGTAPDAVAYQYAYGKDAGRPGAWVPGTPGLNGAATNCDSAAGATIAGANILPDAASGSYYLTQVGLTSSVAHLHRLIDVLWYNTGLVVTTTTGQAIVPAALPARDLNGSTNGEGVHAALYFTGTATNVAVNNTATLTYTDSEGNAGNTATLSALAGDQIPVTALLGTWVPFRLAAGDRGVRSVQTVTLATSLGAGSISLILYRPLASVPNPVVNVGGVMQPVQGELPGVRIYNDTCIWSTFVAGAATATVLNGTYHIMER